MFFCINSKGVIEKIILFNEILVRRTKIRNIYEADMFRSYIRTFSHSKKFTAAVEKLITIMYGTSVLNNCCLGFCLVKIGFAGPRTEP